MGSFVAAQTFFFMSYLCIVLATLEKHSTTSELWQHSYKTHTHQKSPHYVNG